MSEAPLAPRGSAALGPAACLQRLATPLHVIEVQDEVIFYYLKVGARKGAVDLRRLDPSVAREVAMLTVNRRTQRFTVQWYPWAEQPQVVQDLPFDQLPAMISDLVGAGFGAPAATGVSNSTLNPCNRALPGHPAPPSLPA